MIRAAIFDIDCTLVVTGGAGMRALSYALSSFDDRFEELPPDYSPHGKTDPLIFHELFDRFLGRPPDSAEQDRLKASYLGRLTSEMRQCTDQYIVLPGVTELLDRLSAEGIALGLGTGNYAEGAHIKLRQGNLNRYFTFGGFGCDAQCRTEMLRTAVARSTFSAEECVIIGDTPRDIDAARGIGSRVIAVATGVHSLDDLAGADLAVPTLEDRRVYDFLIEKTSRTNV